MQIPHREQVQIGLLSFRITYNMRSHTHHRAANEIHVNFSSLSSRRSLPEVFVINAVLASAASATPANVTVTGSEDWFNSLRHHRGKQAQLAVLLGRLLLTKRQSSNDSRHYV